MAPSCYLRCCHVMRGLMCEHHGWSASKHLVFSKRWQDPLLRVLRQLICVGKQLEIDDTSFIDDTLGCLRYAWWFIPRVVISGNKRFKWVLRTIDNRETLPSIVELGVTLGVFQVLIALWGSSFWCHITDLCPDPPIFSHTRKNMILSTFSAVMDYFTMLLYAGCTRPGISFKWSTICQENPGVLVYRQG